MLKRNIMFRGISIETGKMVDGYYYYDDGNESPSYIRTQNKGLFIDTPILEETLGQYTEIDDCNGMPIFEGDIMKDKFGNIGIILWDGYDCSYILVDAIDYIQKKSFYESSNIMVQEWCENKVLGNIHENINLLNRLIN